MHDLFYAALGDNKLKKQQSIKSMFLAYVIFLDNCSILCCIRRNICFWHMSFTLHSDNFIFLSFYSYSHGSIEVTSHQIIHQNPDSECVILNLLADFFFSSSIWVLHSQPPRCQHAPRFQITKKLKYNPKCFT